MPIFLALGLVALGYFVGRNRGRSSAPLMLSSGNHDPGGYAMTRAAGLPGPIQVLVGFMKQDKDPPPVVVQHAIAEAKSIGQHGLASDIAQTFGSPDQQKPIIDMPPRGAYAPPHVAPTTPQQAAPIQTTRPTQMPTPTTPAPTPTRQPSRMPQAPVAV